MSDIERVNEIEHLIATGKLNAAQVFTQMKQLLQAAREQEGEAVVYMIEWDDGDVDLVMAPMPATGEEPLSVTPLYTHPPKAQGVPEGWTLKKVVDDMTTISITRDSDGAWCGGGIKEDSGASGLRYEFLDALLSTTPQPDKPEGGRSAWPEMPDKFYEGLGWMHAECCAALDSGEDPRTFEVGGMVERCIKDLTAPPADKEKGYE